MIIREPTQEEQLRFEIAVRNNLAQPRRAGESIGTYGEKRMHSILKHFISPDESHHEIKMAQVISLSSAGKYVADVLQNDTIYEIQTGGFFPLQEKIKWYLENTNFHVKVIHPMACLKWTRWIDPQTGTIAEKRKSPKKERVLDSVRELYWLIPFMNNPRFSISFMGMELEEYRIQNGWGRDNKRGGSRYEKIPLKLLSVNELNNREDYACFLPDSQILPRPFTPTEYGKAMKLKGTAIYGAVKLLCETGFIVQEGCKGRSKAYIDK